MVARMSIASCGLRGMWAGAWLGLDAAACMWLS
eukprot:CAMPEP_0182902586 /NCGR_PEP_ID=MMETSP0034_2-20130328/30592_1 /TAXON_ID=156128 /ORGANISM="Nephroselmis pyriformis, Strain CCMP717" /LENGTH=32 /DNA_ID= /DNA_START= /DNA_END= /DNA_ORIENTATION=